MIKSNKLVFYSIVLCSFMIMNFTCNNCDDTLHDQSSFNISIGTEANTYILGDTIKLSVSFSSQLDLEFSGDIYNSNELGFQVNFNLFQAQASTSATVQGRDNFKIIDLNGDIFLPESRDWTVEVVSKCESGLCEAEIGLLPISAGYYGVQLNTGFIYTESACESVELIPFKTEPLNTNGFDLYKEIKVDGVSVNNTYYEDPASENRLYFLKVIK